MAGTLLRSGAFRPTRPDRALRVAAVLRDWGSGVASGYMIPAIRDPHRPAIVDDRGSLTFAEVDRRTNALAHALCAQGIGEGERVAILCRNHRGFIESTVALAKLGADAIYLNTELSAPAVTDALARERPAALICDEELAPPADGGAFDCKRFIAWRAGAAKLPHSTLDELVARGDRSPRRPPRRPGRHVILTSGTTGAPKGALRPQPSALGQAAAVYSRVPWRARQATVVAAPLFHSWGLGGFLLGLPLSSTLVLIRRFDAERTLRAVAEERASVLVVVPLMLRRIVELSPETIARHDLSCLRVIVSSGAALPGELSGRVMDAFGEVLYNLYGATEVAWATIATPSELRAAPGTAGRAPLGTVVKLVGDDGSEVAPGERGRIGVFNSFLFDGYTDGAAPRLGGLIQTGDIGHLDEQGRLFVDGREDEMIVSGGENVYPREVEDLLAAHEDVEEAAVVGVKDAEFGQRLRAFVVPRDGATLAEEDIKGLVRANLARYKVPRDVIFLPELPRTATGKIVKHELNAPG